MDNNQFNPVKKSTKDIFKWIGLGCPSLGCLLTVIFSIVTCSRGNAKLTDAFSDEGSIRARENQFKQIVDYINARTAENDRPVIVTGDFNTYMHSCNYDSDMYTYFQEQCGLKDAWNELCNGGDYFEYQKWYDTGVEAWGNWDSVERFMYKSGGGVELVATDFKYIKVVDESGNAVSDHSAAECSFDFIKTPDFVENTQELKVVEKTDCNALHNIKWTFKALVKIFTNFDFR